MLFLRIQSTVTKDKNIPDINQKEITGQLQASDAAEFKTKSASRPERPAVTAQSNTEQKARQTEGAGGNTPLKRARIPS